MFERALFERALFESALPLAEGGDAVAQYRVGVIYFDGLGGVPRDRKAGLEWMQRAAAGGHAEARFQLGRIYETGEGAPVDHKRAYELYGAAAEQAHGNAGAGVGNDVSYRRRRSSERQTGADLVYPGR